MRIVAICSDTVDEIAKGQQKHHWGFPVLADDTLTVTDLYNLRMERGVAMTRGPVRPLAIPTTFLVGADGLVKWIDQAEDYRVRSDADRVLAAIEKALA